MVSAHWEEPVATLMTSPHPPMLYDYYNFPASTYALQWPAPGATDLAPTVSTMLGRAGFEVRSDPNRGFDHGTFVPMMLALPKADLPVLQLSLLRDIDPARHLALGEALAPLRDEGVLMLGSGNSYHNMRGFGQARRRRPARRSTTGWSRRSARIANPAPEADRLGRRAGRAACHPREEHLLPLHVMAGAAGADPGRPALRIEFSAVQNTCVQFGG